MHREIRAHGKAAVISVNKGWWWSSILYLSTQHVLGLFRDCLIESLLPSPELGASIPILQRGKLRLAG